jgi:hypothetical protein
MGRFSLIIKIKKKMIEIQEEELKKIMSVLGEIPSKYSIDLIVFFQKKIQDKAIVKNENSN